MNIRGIITIGLVSFCIIAGRASFLLYNAYESARLEAEQHQIALDVNHPSVKMHWVSHTLILEGMVENQGEKIRAEQIALAHLSSFHLRNLFQPPQVVNALTISVPDQAAEPVLDDRALASDFD
jgi:hypothetical protein